jgi:hypothetical protein
LSSVSEALYALRRWLRIRSVEQFEKRFHHCIMGDVAIVRINMLEEPPRRETHWGCRRTRLAPTASTMTALRHSCAATWAASTPVPFQSRAAAEAQTRKGPIPNFGNTNQTTHQPSRSSSVLPENSCASGELSVTTQLAWSPVQVQEPRRVARGVGRAGRRRAGSGLA